MQSQTEKRNNKTKAGLEWPEGKDIVSRALIVPVVETKRSALRRHETIVRASMAWSLDVEQLFSVLHT